MKSVLVQFLPPSVLRYTPRISLFALRFPSAAARTMSGLTGSTTIDGITRESSRPRWRHVTPASSER
jgi:hypothetical protein